MYYVLVLGWFDFLSGAIAFSSHREFSYRVWIYLIFRFNLKVHARLFHQKLRWFRNYWWTNCYVFFFFFLLFSFGDFPVGLCSWCIGLQCSCGERGQGCNFSCCGAAYWWWMGCWYNAWYCSRRKADRQGLKIFVTKIYFSMEILLLDGDY